MEKLIDTALAQSIWAGLSIILIFYILRKQEIRDIKQEEREVKYQNIISNLTEKLHILKNLETGIKEIRNFIKK